MSHGEVWILTLVLIVLGTIGSVAPMVPGATLIFVAGVLDWRLWPGSVSPWTLGALAVLSALTLVAEWAASALGSKVFGGSRWSLAGAPLGALCGLPFGLAGILAGAVLGAAAAEAVLAGRSAPRALRAGVGAGLGVLAGTIARVAIALSMSALLVANLLLH